MCTSAQNYADSKHKSAGEHKDGVFLYIPWISMWALTLSQCILHLNLSTSIHEISHFMYWKVYSWGEWQVLDFDHLFYSWCQSPLKGIIHPNMRICWKFTQAIQDVDELFSLSQEINPNNSESIIKHYTSKAPFLDEETISSKSYMAWGWVHFQKIYIFGWTIPLRAPITI